MSIVGAYADGGVCGSSRSHIAGAAAWCLVDEHDQRTLEASILLPACNVPGGTVTNNQTECCAMIRMLEALPSGWSGPVYTDSAVTRGRLFPRASWANHQPTYADTGLLFGTVGIPDSWVQRGLRAVARLGKIEAWLLQGHPTADDLRRGVGAKRGLPVSKHQVWTDNECQRLTHWALTYFERGGAWPPPPKAWMLPSGDTAAVPIVVPPVAKEPIGPDAPLDHLAPQCPRCGGDGRWLFGGFDALGAEGAPCSRCRAPRPLDARTGRLYDLPVAACKACPTLVYWLKHVRTGYLSPIDVRPDPKGNIVIGTLGGEPVYQVVRAGDPAHSGHLHSSHFVTCTEAATFKIGGARRR